MSATDISPAPRIEAQASLSAAQGNNIARPPNPESHARRVPADGHETAPEPMVAPQARPASARVHEPATEPSAISIAMEVAAPSHETSSAPNAQAKANVLPAQGNQVGSTPRDHPPQATRRAASTHATDPPVTQDRSESQSTGGDGWIELRVWAEMYYDAQKARISCTNRIERGGIDGALFAPQLATLKAAEHELALSLRECYRRTTPKPILDWQKPTIGIGAPALARLLGHLGDPSTRSLRQLWSYCGHGDAERKRRKGMTQAEALSLGSPTCKMIVHQLLASTCIRFEGTEHHGRSAYRDVYDEARIRYADREHATECTRCGPAGKPAPAGSPWSLAHQHAAGIRLVGKEILRDLWLASRE